MPRVQLKPLCKDKYCELSTELLKRLERIGKDRIKEDLQRTLLSVLNQNDLNDKEFLSRYLLLAAVLDQQAKSETARKVVVEIYKKYGRDFFMNPHQFIDKIDEILDLVLSIYQSGLAHIRIPREGITLLRIGGFILALINITKNNKLLINYLKNSDGPRDLLRKILNNKVLRGLLYEKAARMYVGWVSHPDLFVNIFEGKYSVSQIPMVIDGHVCKVLARTGFLDSVLVENTEKYIVQAEEERRRIESLVSQLYPTGDYFMIDYGAFHVGITYCHEEKPECGKCPLNDICKKNIHIRAY